MKKSLLTLVALAALMALLCLYIGGGSVEAAKPAAKVSKTSCAACHPELSAVVPKGHPPVKGSDIAACLGCHKPDASGKADKNKVSTGLHRAHVGEGGKLDCMSCHTWKPGKSFGLQGQKVSFGSPTKDELEVMKKVFASWKSSGYTDSLHNKANIVCGGCHGSAMAKEGDTVENSRCLECHGPMEKLAKKSEPQDFPDRNPHKSHLGEIACTVCHKGHAESKTYCLECHKLFKMKKIPGGSASQ